MKNRHLLFRASAILCLLVMASSASAQVTTVQAPMRDGVKLATDLYRADRVKQAPVVLMRTPYDRTKQKGTGEYWAKAGYIFVVQDCRGTRDSQGAMAPYNNEGQDGYDTIEWITAQKWCNGRVGMIGGSYVGAVQWQAAVENPQGLDRSAGNVEQLLSQPLPRWLGAVGAHLELDRGQHAEASRSEG